MGLIPGSQIKKNTIETGIVQEWDENRGTGEAYWAVYYKTVKFGEFDQLSNASDRLSRLIELDTAPPEKKPTTGPSINIKG